MRGVYCPGCDKLSGIIYRCEYCGHDLAGEQQSVGQRGETL